VSCRIILAAALLVMGCRCTETFQAGPAPTPGNDQCLMPLVASCLNTDAGIVSCENASDTKCGLVSGTSAQVWSGVEQAEIIQGFSPKGN
jgi:hypothetical protein